VQNLVARETWRPGFVISVLMYLDCYIIVRLKFISTFYRICDLLMLIMKQNTTASSSTCGVPCLYILISHRP